jgi:hypothetical protein
MDAQAVIAALRDRARKFVSLDTPEDSDLGDLAIDIGAGFVPVVGTATSGRDFERARREGDLLGMSLSAAGMLPVVGGVASAANKVRKGKKGAEEVAGKLDAPELREAIKAAVKESEQAAKAGPPDPLANFGRKAEADAARESKVKKAAAAEPAEKAKNVGDGRREARPATYYREMAKTQGPDAVLAAARQGDHLHRTPDGGYVGAPRDLKSPQALTGLRNRLDRNVEISAQEINHADPARPAGSWYPRAKAGMAETSEPWRIGRDVEAHSVYSAGVSPASETDLALKHSTSRAIGAPRRAKYQDQADALDFAVAEDRAAKLGAKTGEYGPKIDPREPGAGQFGVNDFRNAQSFGYTHPTGEPWRAGVTAPMHQFMDAETALQVDRLNRAGAGGRSDWTGPMTQEVPWISGKAQDLYERGKNASYAGGREGIIRALRDANATMADSIPKHSFSATHEEMPGFNVGHLSQLHNMPAGVKDQYSNAATWALRNADADLYPGMPSSIGAGPRDVLHSAAQFRTLPVQQHLGRYTNSAGQVENNLSNVSTALVDLRTGEHAVEPNTMKTLEAIENMRGGIDAQEASAGHIVHTAKAIPAAERNAGIIDTGRRPLAPDEIDSTNAQMGSLRSDPNKVAAVDKALAKREGTAMDWTDVAPTSNERIVRALRDGTGLSVSPSSRGALVANFDTAYDDPEVASAAIRMAQKAGLPVESGRLESFYIPHSYGEGQKTTSILQGFADLPEGVSQTVSRNLSESPDVRKKIASKIERDANPQFGGGARDDIQLMRKFFSEADWAKAVELMRKGVAPAAAVAALGYSLNSMAAEDQR